MRSGLSFAYTLFLTVSLTTFFGLIACLLWPLDWLLFRHRIKDGEGPPIGTWVKKTWCYFMFRMHGLKAQLHGPAKDRLENFKGCVFVSNHQSALDILVQMSHLPKATSFVAKKELSRIPIFGLAAKVVGAAVYIDRSKGTQEASLQEAVKRIQYGLPVLMYAEGTRSKEGQLLPFKRGAFIMAIQAQVPIVPLTVINSYKLCPKGRLSVSPGVIDMVIDEPIPTVGMTAEDRFDLSERVRKQMAKNLDQFA